MEKEKTISSKYIQQHLANERTYLAWIRTAIAIVGIGFLITNLHFNFMSKASTEDNTLTIIIGLFSITCGFSLILFSTFDYIRKTKQIDEQTFLPSKHIVIWLSALLAVIVLIFSLYFFLIL
ncbi:YidH family protein [Metabacillus sp. RGM 3146]|uniref:YidH family protein n=1 Tax=Metabacillus sp. RGM 3146 TaxID=3401092 RepID=UPI003B9C897F